MSNDLNSSLFSTPEMTLVFSASQQLRAMIRFEWALSCALEKQGIAQPGSGAVLEELLDANFVDLDLLERETRQAGNIAIPLVRELTAMVKRKCEAAARTVHQGATSQDVLDTALVLQIRDGLKLVVNAMEHLGSVLTTQARTHATTVMMGRTWLQPGPPVTLGLKLAGTLAALRRHRARVDAAAERVLVLQFGGAVGTLAALGRAGAKVSSEISRILDLKEPDIPWHTQRDNVAEIAQVLGLIVGTLGKFARDIALLMQVEIAEVSEPAGENRGGSSTMPHKCNPVACATVLAVATRVPGLVATLLSAMPQEHERGLGLWQAEWETVPELFRLTAAALARAIEIAEGLEVDAARMISNLDSTFGLPLSEAVSVALALKIGRSEAHEVLREATLEVTKSKEPLASVLKRSPQVTAYLSDAEIDRLLTPREYLGSTQRFIDRVLGETDVDR